MTWAFAFLRTKYGMGLVLALVAGIGYYGLTQYWKAQGRADVEQEALKDELEAHERINNAETGSGATDDERSAWCAASFAAGRRNINSA